jgi:putative transposase
MERVSLEWDFTVQARVLGLAQFGGRIERIMGRASYEMEFLPGKTFRSVVEKRDHDPEKLAVFNLLDLEQYLMIFFALVYNNSPHRGLRRRTPLNRWLEGEKAMGGLSRVQPAPDPSLLMNLLPSVDRTIQQDGVSWETITYFDPAIIPYIHTANPESTDGKFRFHYYPRDIRTLYTRLPGVHQWIQVRAKDLGMAPMSIWERDDANSADREAAKDERAEERARRGRAKLSEISDQKEAFALKEHRRQKRIQRSKTKGRTEVTQTETVPQANPAEFALESELRRLTTLECVPDPSLWENIPRIVGRNL